MQVSNENKFGCSDRSRSWIKEHEANFEYNTVILLSSDESNLNM